jgi:UDP-N-acetylglucosamine 3-dehydrogenase
MSSAQRCHESSLSRHHRAEPFRCAVIGLGHMGQAHAAVIAASERAALAFCCDRDPAKQAATPPGARFTSDPDAVFDQELDMVFIATPEPTHSKLASDALTHGLHVFCEKPIAATIGQADEMLRAADAAQSLLCIGHISRFDPRYQHAQAAVASGQLGRIRHITASRLTHTGERDYYSKRTSLAVELAVHDLDILRWLGGDIESVFAIQTQGTPTDSLMAAITFRSGAIASITSSWGVPEGCGLDGGSRLSVLGDGGVLLLEELDDLELYSTQSQERDSALASNAPRAAGMPLVAEINHFFDCAAGHAQWPLTLDDARAALAAALALNQSIETQSPVHLSAETARQEA